MSEVPGHDSPAGSLLELLPDAIHHHVCSLLEPTSLRSYFAACTLTRHAAAQHVETLVLRLPHDAQQASNAAAFGASAGLWSGRRMRMRLEGDSVCNAGGAALAAFFRAAAANAGAVRAAELHAQAQLLTGSGAAALGDWGVQHLVTLQLHKVCISGPLAFPNLAKALPRLQSLQIQDAQLSAGAATTMPSLSSLQSLTSLTCIDMCDAAPCLLPLEGHSSTGEPAAGGVQGGSDAGQSQEAGQSQSQGSPLFSISSAPPADEELCAADLQHLVAGLTSLHHLVIEARCRRQGTLAASQRTQDILGALLHHTQLRHLRLLLQDRGPGPVMDESFIGPLAAALPLECLELPDAILISSAPEELLRMPHLTRLEVCDLQQESLNPGAEDGSASSITRGNGSADLESGSLQELQINQFVLLRPATGLPPLHSLVKPAKCCLNCPFGLHPEHGAAPFHTLVAAVAATTSLFSAHYAQHKVQPERELLTIRIIEWPQLGLSRAVVEDQLLQVLQGLAGLAPYCYELGFKAAGIMSPSFMDLLGPSDLGCSVRQLRLRGCTQHLAQLSEALQDPTQFSSLTSVYLTLGPIDCPPECEVLAELCAARPALSTIRVRCFPSFSHRLADVVTAAWADSITTALAQAGHAGVRVVVEERDS